MELIKNANLLLRFLLELCVLFSVGYWGFKGNSSIVGKLGMGLILPIAVMVFWAIFIAPNSAHQLQLPFRLVMELVVFGLGAFALYASGNKNFAAIFSVVVILNMILMFIWKQ